MTLKIYVEGGGDGGSLRNELRLSFSQFFKSAGLAGSMPRVFASGSRKDAYDDFCREIAKGDNVLLLIDSESEVDEQPECNDSQAFQPWEHLRQRKGDGWAKPASADDSHCHLMVQCMESWFIADVGALQEFFGKGFDAAKLPHLPSQPNAIEVVDKQKVYDGLENATKNCKASYRKGSVSFQILGKVDAKAVCAKSPWARRLIDELRARAPR